MARVPANSYGNGRKYAGGNTFINADGSVEKIYGYHTSPSGKVTYTYEDDSIIVLDGANFKEIGTIYKDNKVIYQPKAVMSYIEIKEKAADLAVAGRPIENYFIEAAKILGEAME